MQSVARTVSTVAPLATYAPFLTASQQTTAHPLGRKTSKNLIFDVWPLAFLGLRFANGKPVVDTCGRQDASTILKPPLCCVSSFLQLSALDLVFE
uniref:Uncharacterized protein n=1 Tax=Ixodes ricinus TaxID=34613 RepID=A0A6B0UF11_IXORI